MRNHRFVPSRLLGLILPVTLGLACGLKRDWSICAPADKQPCLPGYVCTPDLLCVPAGDGGTDGFVSVDSEGPTDAALAGVGGPMSAGTDGPGSSTPGPDAGGSPGSALPDGATGTTPGLDGSGGADGGSGSNAAPDVPVAPPDALSPLAVGAPCSVSSDCAAGNCVDGVCCDRACAGCNACKQKLTGKADGTCAPATSGHDPHNTCTDETATCGNDGTCDGAGACRKVSNNQICTPSSCSGTTFTPAATCDGAGACPAAKTQDCAPFKCALTGCLKTCASQTDCDSTTSYCDTASNTCAAKLSNGSTALQGFQCTSGIVADGVCCNKACTGCSACTSDLDGQASTTTGQCLPVVAGKAAPHSACTANPPCGLDGTCDGSGSCRYPPSGTSCAADSCTGSTLTTSACNSAHACSATTSACPSSAACADSTSCGTKKVPGVACTGPSDCASGNCEDTLSGTSRICCSSSCSTCQGCNSNGVGCTNKPSGAFDTACSYSGANCTAAGCDGGGRCSPASSSTICGTGACTNGSAGNGQWTVPTFQTRTCNGTATGSNACHLTAGNVGCTGHLVCLDSTSCRTSCVQDTDCIDGYYCASDGTCQARMPISPLSVCTRDQQCQSRVCVGSCVECDTPDDCPRTRPACVNNVCIRCDADPEYLDEIGCHVDPNDGSMDPTLFCGTRTFPQTDYTCRCGSLNECPIGSVCTGTSCLIRGGQPCVTDNCAFGHCPSGGGTCPGEPPNLPCAKTSPARSASSGCSAGCTNMCWDPGNYGDYSCCV